MQDARNQNTTALLPIEQDVLAVLMTAQARTDVIAESARVGVVGEHLATGLKLAKIAGGLSFAPFTKGVIGNAQEVGLSAARKVKFGH